ncbi:MAG: hypothetical protein ACREH5_04760, partial [Candidatus Omnitrophota bacterium]
AYAVISILFGLGLADLIREACKASSSTRRIYLQICVYFACLVQLLALGYGASRLVSVSSQSKNRTLLIQIMKQIPGDVFAPFAGYLARLAGKKPFVHTGQIWDVVRSKDGPIKDKFMRELQDAFKEKRFGAVFLPPMRPEKFREQRSIDRNKVVSMGDWDADMYWRWWEEFEFEKYYAPAKLPGISGLEQGDLSHCFGPGSCVYVPKR